MCQGSVSTASSSIISHTSALKLVLLNIQAEEDQSQRFATLLTATELTIQDDVKPIRRLASPVPV
jgi:hypothetical protein